MKVGKWITLVVVWVLLFSVGCATGVATSVKSPREGGAQFEGGGYRHVTP
jgi:hypothetical protein